MGAIIGFFAFVALLAVGIYFSIRPSVDYDYDLGPDDLYTEYDYQKELFDTARKSMKLNMMQIDVYRAMEEVAERHSHSPRDIFAFEEENER